MAFFSKKNKLFPSVEPFDTGFIKKGIHEIYYEQSGNQKASQPFSAVDRVEVAELFQDVFLIQKNIELLFLIKEAAGEANLMLH